MRNFFWPVTRYISHRAFSLRYGGVVGNLCEPNFTRMLYSPNALILGSWNFVLSYFQKLAMFAHTYLLIEKVSDSPKLFDPCVVTYSKPLDIPI